MTMPFNSKILRRPEVLKQIGISKTTLHLLQTKGLFVTPISIGERAVGYLEYEVKAIIAARAAEKPPEYVINLVKVLETQRRSISNRFLDDLNELGRGE